MPAIGGGVNQHVIGTGGDAAFQHRLQFAIFGFVFVKRQVIAEEDVSFGTFPQQFGDILQVRESLFTDADEPESIVGIARQHRFHEGGFAGAPVSPE